MEKSKRDLPYIRFAIRVVNLVASYEPTTASQQFQVAQSLFGEPAIAKFKEVILETEQEEIDKTQRSQTFFIHEGLVEVELFVELNSVVVRIPGLRTRTKENKLQSKEEMVYYIKMDIVKPNLKRNGKLLVRDFRSRKAN